MLCTFTMPECAQMRGWSGIQPLASPFSASFHASIATSSPLSLAPSFGRQNTMLCGIASLFWKTIFTCEPGAAMITGRSYFI